MQSISEVLPLVISPLKCAMFQEKAQPIRNCFFRTFRVEESFWTKKQSCKLWKVGIEKCRPFFDFVCFNRCHFTWIYKKWQCTNLIFQLFTNLSNIFQPNIKKLEACFSFNIWNKFFAVWNIRVYSRNFLLWITLLWPVMTLTLTKQFILTCFFFPGHVRKCKLFCKFAAQTLRKFTQECLFTMKNL